MYKKLFVLFMFISLTAQNTILSQTGLGFLTIPASVTSGGLGNQGAASLKSEDALTYNPANLSNTRDIELNYYVRPSCHLGMRRPFTTVSLAIPAGKLGAFGLQYSNIDYGDTQINVFDIETFYENFERSLAIGYALSLAEGLNAGASIRYAHSNFQEKFICDEFFMSLGLNYTPPVLDQKLRLGFSILNLGGAVTFGEYENPAPAYMHLGLSASPIMNDYFGLSLQGELSKVLVNTDDSGHAKSSFNALFTDWKNCPRDIDAHLGLGFVWQPLNLGKGYSYFQEFYLGDESSGMQYFSGSTWYTHSMTAGIQKDGFKLSAGVMCTWHIATSSYDDLQPRESFQFSASVSPDYIFRKKENREYRTAGLKNIILSAGTGYTMNVGKYKECTELLYSDCFDNSERFQIEAAFYISNSSALITSLQYSLVPYKFRINLSHPDDIAKFDFNNLALYSAYRYHPLAACNPLYVQGGLGIIHSKITKATSIPTNINISNDQQYATVITLGTGAVIRAIGNFCVTPYADYTLMLKRYGNSTPNLGGFNCFNIGINAGYEF